MKTVRLAILAALVGASSFAATLHVLNASTPVIGEVMIGRLGLAVEMRYSLFTVAADGQVQKSGAERVDYLRLDDIAAVRLDPAYGMLPSGRIVAAMLVLSRGQRDDAPRFLFLFRPGKEDEAREVADVLAQTIFLPPNVRDSQPKTPAPSK